MVASPGAPSSRWRRGAPLRGERAARPSPPSRASGSSSSGRPAAAVYRTASLAVPCWTMAKPCNGFQWVCGVKIYAEPEALGGAGAVLPICRCRISAVMGMDLVNVSNRSRSFRFSSAVARRLRMASDFRLQLQGGFEWLPKSGIGFQTFRQHLKGGHEFPRALNAQKGTVLEMRFHCGEKASDLARSLNYWVCSTAALRMSAEAQAVKAGLSRKLTKRFSSREGNVCARETFSKCKDEPLRSLVGNKQQRRGPG